MLFVIIIGTAIKDVTVFYILANNQIPVLTLGATTNIVFVNLIVGHKITSFRFVGADPKIQTVILVKLIL